MVLDEIKSIFHNFSSAFIQWEKRKTKNTSFKKSLKDKYFLSLHYCCFQKNINEVIGKSMLFRFCKTSLYFLVFPVSVYSLFLWIPPKHYSVSRMFFSKTFYVRPWTFVQSNASIFFLLNLLHESFFLNFLKLKNLFMTALEYRLNKQSSITRSF